DVADQRRLDGSLLWRRRDRPAGREAVESVVEAVPVLRPVGVEGIGGHGPTGRRGRRSREGELHRPLRGGELDPLPGLVRLLGGLHDRVARAPELVALRAPLREELHVVLLRAHPALSEALDPVAAGRCGADAAGREQTDEGVPAALLRADGEALLDELPHVLEGLVDAFARGVGAGPQVAAGALLARVEPGP